MKDSILISLDMEAEVKTPVAVLSKVFESARAAAKASGVVVGPSPIGVLADLGVPFFEPSLEAFAEDFSALAASRLSFDAWGH